jgi:hypothetical protein
VFIINNLGKIHIVASTTNEKPRFSVPFWVLPDDQPLNIHEFLLETHSNSDPFVPIFLLVWLVSCPPVRLTTGSLLTLHTNLWSHPPGTGQRSSCGNTGNRTSPPSAYRTSSTSDPPTQRPPDPAKLPVLARATVSRLAQLSQRRTILLLSILAFFHFFSSLNTNKVQLCSCSFFENNGQAWAVVLLS